MKLHTDVTTLSKLYPLFKETGLEGVLSGDFSQIQNLTFPSLTSALLCSGSLPEICSIITRSEYFTPEDQDPGTIAVSIPWVDASLEACMGVIVPFLIDIAVGPLNLKDLANQAPPMAIP